MAERRSVVVGDRKILTIIEWEAVETALNQCLAGEVLDGFDEHDSEHGRKWRAMERALAKVQHNLDLMEQLRGDDL